MRPLASAIIGAVTTATVLGGAIAWAAVPDSETDQISGCYQKNSGALRVIDSENGQTCRSSEIALTWAQQGPAGDPGAPGQPGPPGLARVYVVEAERASAPLPDGHTIPPSLDDQHQLQDGEFVVSCEAGDVALSVVFFASYEIGNYSMVDGSQIDVVRGVPEGPVNVARPVIVDGEPVGYTNVGSANYGTFIASPNGTSGTFLVSRSALHMDVTCADTTP